ncbi:hypothetical protein M501DRAFT_999228 [Patellaria atrata CBS 101060]|uniref:Uncharacterized protein n=1 Tax=Patellaria atrata CBS 101060 TaxID=1346257 RepID=A0A9P4S361_9PEZI|nr:hypothetical protein M501DRAFT_999228 [Patellaria atrata CBS 101060]
MFFKRLSRSRTNSYVDEYDSPNSKRDSKHDSGPERPHSEGQHEPVSQHNTNILNSPSGPLLSSSDSNNPEMYPRGAAAQEPYVGRGTNGTTYANGMSHNALPMSDPTQMNAGKTEPMPDLLARAFNEAVRPYTDRIEQLENQVADLQSWVEQLEQQRAEVHSWIDKRGLRPDVPPSIAKTMDSLPSPTHAAETLNAQLDRKITIVNFDLHRLQDDLNDSISASHFASAMSKFLPDIARLAALPTGSRYAFDLILKLGGNLNSHGGLDSGDQEDLEARRSFYTKLDGAMVDVVRGRFAENEEWAVQREVKRIEKTAAYLRGFGIEPYFPATLDVMRRELEAGSRQNGATTGNVGQGVLRGTPPRYQ